ncbi:MAG: tRNA (adenosine(37)-N6)-dimethylallyltransferase MiaA [Gammaproteobacteria bacterium]|nr:tRNA (adenosine(37)-N6)-dimethylallyltransferase MiaA [Gammaproteobacteria bacterium]
MVDAICLAGPTGMGKTDLALRLASEFAVEIVSVDSALVYRHLDIGTAKPSAAVRAAIPHHLIDICEPWERYSAGRFRADALHAIEAIRARGSLPLLVGGTMLYLRALQHGLAPLPEARPEVRAAIDREAAERGWPAMHAELRLVDPLAASRIRPGDRQRIQRALEVYRVAGRPISALQTQHAGGPGLRFLGFALVPEDRAVLYRRLDERLAAMVEEGFVDEVRRLRAMPLMSDDLPSLRAVGYRQLWQYLAGAATLDEALRAAAVATHRLAKRQLTWLRAEAAYRRLDPAAGGVFEAVADALQASGVSRGGR